jgi:predicted GH43/DUF377 family glycosyl hydrolase
MTTPLARRTGLELSPDPARVIARLFIPGEEMQVPHSRAHEIVARVMALKDPDVDELVARLLDTFASRHRSYQQLLISHASIVAAHAGEGDQLSESRRLLLGASVTAEYATEGAALCNPSAVLHPDQTSLANGQVRAAISVRAIGEGHLSAIAFCSAIVGPGARWSFNPRPLPITAGVVRPTHWHRTHLQALLTDKGHVDELGRAVLQSVPAQFGGVDLERALGEVHPGLLAQPRAATTLQLIRHLISSAYAVEFDPEVALEQRVVMPSAAEESNGMEDARFTRYIDEDGNVDYRATYTAYDGHHIAPRLLTSPDLRVFRSRRLAGPAARNKGMALFPRLIQGRHVALCRSDGESTSVTTSHDGYVWTGRQVVHEPTAAWESLQVGNCGSPIETERGWLVLTHGVGPMRTYSIGAMLLDLDDPAVVLGRLERPLLEPDRDEQDGYVPNVVYSCGGLVHDGLLWLPYGINDARIGVAWVPLDEVLAALSGD